MDVEYHQDFLTLSKPQMEEHQVMMQYFAIAMTALLVTTKSPKDCEDGWFTGYLITLSMFSVCVFLTLICYALMKAYKLKTKYYLHFFYGVLALNLVLLLINFLYNAVSGNDCGIYSVRGFAAGLITICSIGSFAIFFIISVLLNLYEKLNVFLEKKHGQRITEKLN